MSLRQRIIEEIRERGPMQFSRYMERCLYDPELGYYSRAQEQFGKGGDFYTSSDVHAVFGRLLARQFQQMWQALGAPPRLDLVELGPGRGLFAQDVLDWARKKFPGFFQALHYTLVEISPALRARLQQRFANEAKVKILGGLEGLPRLDDAIVFANEFFDALPVEVVRGAEDVERRESLRLNADRERLVEEFVPANSAELEFLDRYGVHPAAEERCEVTQEAIEYMRQIAGLFRRGFVLIIDYGYTREELLAGRRSDTLRAFRRHTISDSVYEAPGEQDITANVNFTALRETGLEHGMESGWILTQSQLLMGIGETNEFADAFEDARLPQEKAKVALQLKHLVTPAGIGEIFQTLMMQRGVDPEMAAALDGLRYK